MLRRILKNTIYFEILNEDVLNECTFIVHYFFQTTKGIVFLVLLRIWQKLNTGNTLGANRQVCHASVSQRRTSIVRFLTRLSSCVCVRFSLVMYE